MAFVASHFIVSTPVKGVLLGPNGSRINAWDGIPLS
jgi:hypothetical protein